MTTSRRAPRRWLALLGLGLATVVLAGCVSLPTDGPVVESEGDQRQEAPAATGIDARPPQEGATRAEIVTGFLEAMTAWPLQTNVAKEYLTDDAADRWDPEQATMVYGESLRPREQGATVTVQLTRADLLDAVGAWRGPVAEADLTVSLELRVEGGEFRIADPPDALLVPASWFQQRYRQVSLYYFDPGGQVLVPEPVFVPVGDQLATHLVDSLIAGPPQRARGVVRSFLPSGLEVGLSVPVDGDGVADITLGGDPPQPSADGAGLMLAQLAWTLRQAPQITAVRLTIGGVEVPIPGGATRYPVDDARQYDPTESAGSPQLFGLSSGRLVGGARGDLVPVSGPFGDEGRALESVAVRPDGQQAAAVDSSGQRVQVASVRATTADPPPRTLLAGADFARPTWDAAGRLWLLDRRAGGAVVWLAEGGRGARRVVVPGVTGENARRLAVSRDGTRLVALRRSGAGDELLSARVRLDGTGGVAGVGRPTLVRKAEANRVLDVAWVAPTRVAVLTPTAPGSLYEVDVVSADGASVGLEPSSTVVTGKVIGLAGAPSQGAAMLAVYENAYVDVANGNDYSAGGATPLTELDYVG